MSTHEPNITSCLPTELLSKIFHHMLDPFDAVEKHIYPERNALELLRVSHVSSYFREVAVNDPSLWAKAPYVNDVHEDFLPVILRRSEPCAIELSFGDYKGLSEDAQTKEQLVQHFSRVSKLQVQIGVPYENSTLKSLFSLPAPSLTDCTLLFLVHSNTSLDSFDRDVLRPFNERAPLLQHLHLINCTIPPEYYDTFPKLSSLSMMQYIGDGLLEDHIPFMPIDDIFKLGKGLSSLHTLTLIKCVQRGGVEFDLDVSQGPVYLPSLRHFHLETSVEGCQQLAKVLKVPATCARELTIIFPGHYRFGLEAANAAAEAVSLFISLNVRYRECSITVVRTAPSLRLVAICGSISTLRFEVSELNVDLPDPAQHLGGGARPSFLRTATGILTPKDIFLHQVWLTLSTSLRRPLSTVLVLNLWVGDGSPAPCLLVELLKSMRCLKELACRTSNLWAHPYIHILLEHDTTPALTKVKIPLDDDVVRPEVLLALNQFLRSRREVREVTFRVPTSTLASMGYAAPDAVRCLIRSVSEHFPDTVALDWVRFQ